ncbi:hypothetical protein LTR08_007860 [Meristemomyces frigidus]|nr:hypothetical protein LTR08_007860 [Meristemomyces frigidus]
MAFTNWARAEGLESVATLDHFAPCHIAIDAEDYLNNLLTTTATREPLLPALGGLPFALQKHVDEDLASFKQAGITPLFVFNGLDVASRDRAMIGREAKKAAATLGEAWSIYDQGKGDEAVVAFGKACTYKTYHIVRWLQYHLHKAGIVTQTAPYIAAAQMVYMEQTGFVDALAGSAACLLFGAEKVITNFDWDTKRISWVELKQCLGKVLMNREPFVDLMLLSGCCPNILPCLPELEQHDSGVARVQSARSLLRRLNDDGHTVCLQQKDADYLNAFCKARFVVRHVPLMTEAGRIESQNAEKLPHDVHEFIGQRLPDELYFYLQRGVAGPRVLNCRTRMQVYETPPLDGGASAAYKELVQEKLRPLRAQALALMTRLLHRYFHKTDVDVVCWFAEGDKRPLGIPDLTEPAAAADTWHVPESTMAKSTGIDVTAGPLFYSIQFLASESAAHETQTPRRNNAPGILSRPRELLANVTWRFLHDRGYINPDHTLSGWGKALKASLDRARASGLLSSAWQTTEAEEAIFMAFELLRLDVLNTKTMFPTPPFSGPPLRGSEADKANTLLVSRIASLGLFRHSTIGYTGPLSRHLLAYHQMTAAVRSALRDLLEMHACQMLLSGAVARDVPASELTDLGARLSFVREPDLGLALIVKSYLDELSNEVGRRSDVKKWFNHAVDVEGDLQKAWLMWEAVNAGVQAADSSIVTNETRKMFKGADDWLQLKREGAPTTNGTP